MKDLTVITICVNYHDYLEECLKFNTKIFDNIIIGTYEDDTNTIELAEQYPVKLVKFPSEGFPLRRGRMLNEILKTISTTWRLVLDADIIVPEKFSLNGLNLEYIYGTPRYIIPNAVAFKKYCSGDRNFFLEKTANAHGYFQLFARHDVRYFENYKGVEYVDLLFKKNFKKDESLNNPVIHLGPTGVNWHKRKTRLWG